MFLMKYTRYNISHVVRRLSCYTHNLSKQDWDALFRLLKYMRGIMYWCLHFNKFPTVLEEFCDANLHSSLYYESGIHCS